MAAQAAPATGDGTTANLLYSVNGGAWSDTVTAQRGDTVTARLFYDTTKESTVTGASLSSQIPDGFTYVPGSTRNVLAPGSNVATGAVGAETKAAAVADSVWSGDALTVSPSAGFNGESNASQSGVLRNGVKRYLNLHQCGTSNGVDGSSSNVNSGWVRAGTNVSNSADTSASCAFGGAASGYTINERNVLPLDLLGNRYLNLHQCGISNGNDSSHVLVSAWASRTGTKTSNSADSAASCAFSSSGGYNLANRNVLSLDLLENRYVNLQQCTITNGVDASTYAVTVPGWVRAGTNASNSIDASPDCALLGGGGYCSNGGIVQPLDLLDTARGQGFIEFAFTSQVPEPAQCDQTVTEP
ncbi:hypothetical protein, partial [Cellulosimicrobium funkei]|uniref:hypothetical protein n=1 Tax=Cellulosimicrobium funkei TaxID=264251 RepID=UPI0036B9A6B2